jgi:hypothetical protein
MLITMDDKEAQRIREFQDAYRQEFNAELTEGEASVMLTQLVQLYLHLSRPLPGTSPSADATVIQS